MTSKPFFSLPMRAAAGGLAFLVLALWLPAVAAAAAGPGAPRQLRCEYRRCPLGIDVARPRLGWFVTDGRRGAMQAAYQILVASSKDKLDADAGDLWDSGRVISSRSIQVVYRGKPLRSGQRCWWKVRTWNKAGRGEPVASPWSKPSWWEMGLLAPEDWKGEDGAAQWIAAPETRAPRAGKGKAAEEPAPLLRKAFEVRQGLKRARAYVCGLGYYELYLNGKKVGDHVLDPAQTDYDHRSFYVAYDVTSLLQPGVNAAGILLGNGWYNQQALRDGLFAYGRPGAIALLRIDYKDGSSTAIVTNGTWKAVPSPIVFNQIYVGEVYDARREIEGWTTADFDDAAYPAARVVSPLSPKLCAQPIEPIKVTGTLRPARRTNPKPGVWVYDLGQNIAGWARITVKAPAGTRVKLTFAEAVHADGMINPASTGYWLIGTPQHDIYIARGGGEETWEPRFTYHGFQYVEVTGLPGGAPPLAVEGRVVHTALERAGEFDSSNAMLNRIYRTALWTLRDNLHGLLTDCPHRERCGWTGDAQVAAETINYNFGAAALWNKYIGDIDTSLVKGLPTAIAPGKRIKKIANPDWGAAIVLLPWYQYRYYGDRRVLAAQYSHMRRFIEYLGELADGYIVSKGYGDWYDPPDEGPQALSIPMPKHTPVALTSTAYYFQAARIMSRTAALLGRADEAARYRRLAAEIRRAFQARFFRPEENSYGSQTADAMALELGIVPEDKRAAAAAALAADIERHNGHFTTGIHGAKRLYVALSATGHGRLAETVLTRTTYPSIGYLFSLGATTMWENWSLTNNHRNNPRSHNHPMNTGFATWFHQALGGINLAEDVPAFRRFLLRPDIHNDLRHVRATHRSPYGWIVSEYDRRSVGSRRAFSERHRRWPARRGSAGGTFLAAGRWRRRVPGGRRKLPFRIANWRGSPPASGRFTVR